MALALPVMAIDPPVILCVEDAHVDNLADIEFANPGPYQGDLSTITIVPVWGPKKGDYGNQMFMSAQALFADFDTATGNIFPLHTFPTMLQYCWLDEFGAMHWAGQLEDAVTYGDVKSGISTGGLLRFRADTGTFFASRQNRGLFLAQAKAHWEFVIVPESVAIAYKAALENAPEVEPTE